MGGKPLRSTPRDMRLRVNNPNVGKQTKKPANQCAQLPAKKTNGGAKA